MKKIIPALVYLLTFCINLHTVQGQSNPKFNLISPTDFVSTISPVADSSTDAIIIADAGITTFKGNSKSWIDYVYKRTTRVKILNKRAFEAATVRIPLYTGNAGKVSLDNDSAVTYNLEDGKVVQSKLDKNDIFTDNINKYYSEYRFTLPAVKENCIIEYSYTVTSSLFQYLPSWRFQSTNYPCLWSEYEITIPNLAVYLISKRGLDPYFVNESEEGHERYMVKRKMVEGMEEEALSVSANTQKHHWVLRNIPAFNTERYISSPENYIDKIDFQLYQTSNGESVHNQKDSWNTFTNEMLNTEYFGAFMSNPEGNTWLEKPVKEIVDGAEDPLQQAKKIYYYLADNFSCTSHRRIYVATSLKEVFKNHKGNVGEINLLLIDMLQSRHITAVPVVLSTKENGYTNAAYPILERLDYAVCKATIDGKVYYLDASQQGLRFGSLPIFCYNGYAKVISNEDTRPLYLLSDSIKEWKTSYVNIINDTTGKGGLQGVYESTRGDMESFDFRSSGKAGQQKYIEDMKSGAAGEIEVTNVKIDSLNKPEGPVKIHAGFTVKTAGSSDVIYISPVLWGDFKANPFEAAKRKYPVEMTYPIYNVNVFSTEIPNGFVVEELPKSIKTLFNGGEASFEYLVQKDEDGIQLKTILKMSKAYFAPEEYDSLRDFFALVAKKQAEQIVFRRKH